MKRYRDPTPALDPPLTRFQRICCAVIWILIIVAAVLFSEWMDRPK